MASTPPNPGQGVADPGQFQPGDYVWLPDDDVGVFNRYLQLLSGASGIVYASVEAFGEAVIQWRLSHRSIPSSSCLAVYDARELRSATESDYFQYWNKLRAKFQKSSSYDKDSWRFIPGVPVCIDRDQDPQKLAGALAAHYHPELKEDLVALSTAMTFAKVWPDEESVVVRGEVIDFGRIVGLDFDDYGIEFVLVRHDAGLRFLIAASWLTADIPKVTAARHRRWPT